MFLLTQVTEQQQNSGAFLFIINPPVMRQVDQRQVWGGDHQGDWWKKSSCVIGDPTTSTCPPLLQKNKEAAIRGRTPGQHHCHTWKCSEIWTEALSLPAPSETSGEPQVMLFMPAGVIWYFGLSLSALCLSHPLLEVKVCGTSLKNIVFIIKRLVSVWCERLKECLIFTSSLAAELILLILLIMVSFNTFISWLWTLLMESICKLATREETQVCAPAERVFLEANNKTIH